MNHITIQNISINSGGLHQHDQIHWKEFLTSLEILQTQCIAAGRRLVTVMGDIRNSDLQQSSGPSRRQLHSQHRALSRALMDPELQSLRRKGSTNVSRLQEKSNFVNNSQILKTKDENIKENYITIRLNEVVTIFNEVDSAAKRLEKLTEQRREKLRELTRQRTLEDEINEVSFSFKLIN